MIQYELLPELRNAVGALTPKLEQVVHTLEWVRIEEFVRSTWGGCGRPELDRGMLANAFVAKAVLGLRHTGKRAAFGRIDARQPGSYTAVRDDGGAGMNPDYVSQRQAFRECMPILYSSL